MTGREISSRNSMRFLASLEMTFLNTEFFHDLLGILPNELLIGGIPQKIGRVKRGHDFKAVPFMKTAAQAADRRFRLQERLRGDFPERADHFRLNNLDLSQKIGRASCRER